MTPLEFILIFIIGTTIIHISLSILQYIHTQLRTVSSYDTYIAQPIAYILSVYTDWWRSRVPDWIYKLWYRTGIISANTYRTFQEKGIISDDLDPEYLQQQPQVETNHD